MKHLSSFLLVVVMCISLCSCGSTDKEADPNALTDAEWGEVQRIFTEYVGKEIEYRPVYCGEWREGKQYKTENYAYGQYLINMDVDGYVHLVVWVQDKPGSEGRTVMYNRLEDENAPPLENEDEWIDATIGTYGNRWDTVLPGTYSFVNDGEQCTLYVVGNDDDNVISELTLANKGDTGEIRIEVGAHLETSVGARVSGTPID